MSTTAYQGEGSTLGTSATGAGGSFTNINQLKKFSFSGLKVKEDDITNLSSPSAFMEILPTVIDPGSVSFDGVLNPNDTGYDNLLTLLQNRTLTYFLITLYGSNATYAFQGYVTELTPVEVQFDKAETFKGSIRITGPVTFTP